MPLPRFERAVGVEVPPVNRLAGAPERDLAAELEDFSARRRVDLQQRADEKGFLEGQQAGAVGAPADAAEWTTRGRAFNRGALIAHQAAMQTDIRDSIGRYALETPDDPEAFSAKVAGLEQGLLKEADPRLQPFVRERIADYAGRAKLGIIGQQQTKLRQEALGDLKHGSDGLFEDATTAAFEGNVPMIEARRQELTRLLDEGVQGGLLPEGDAQELHRKFEHEVTQQEVIGNFDRVVRTQGVDAGTQAIERWQKTKPSEAGLSIDEHEAVTRQLFSLKNRQEALLADEDRKKNALQAAEYVQRRGRVEDTIKVLREGFTPDQDQAKAVAEDLRWLRGTGTPAEQAHAGELARDFDVAQAIQGQVHRFRRLPAPQRAQELDRLESGLREGGASAGQVELLKALKDTNGYVDRQLENDPRGYVNREGLIKDNPLDFSSPDALIGSIEARGANTEVGRQLTGQPLPRLSEAEATQLAGVYKDAEVEQKSAILGVITAGAGDDALATLGQLDKQGNKRMALLGGLVMQGQGELARDIMRGEDVLAGAKEVKPKVSDYGPEIEEAWGAALSDWPEQRGQYEDAAIAKYAELKARAGDLSGDYDRSLMQQAAKAVMPTVEFNDRRIAVPGSLTQDTFDDWVDSWTPETFQGVAGAEPAEILKQVKSRGRLIELGPGRYGIALGSAVTGRDKILMRSPRSAPAEGAVSTAPREPFVLQLPTQ